MSSYMYKVHVNNHSPQMIAQKLKEAGINVCYVGKEYVYLSVEGHKDDRSTTMFLCNSLIQKHNTNYGFEFRKLSIQSVTNILDLMHDNKVFTKKEQNK